MNDDGPRIPPLPPSALAPGDAAGPRRPAAGRRPAIRSRPATPVAPRGSTRSGTLAQHPELSRPSTPSTATSCSPRRLSPRQRELLVLAGGHRSALDLRVGAARVLADDAGLATGGGRPDRRGPDAPGWSTRGSGHARGGRRAARRRHGRRPKRGRCWPASSTSSSSLDLVFTVGAYEVLAMAFRSFGVELDDDLAGNDHSRFTRSMISSDVVGPTGGTPHGALRQARRGQLDRALPPARARGRSPTRTRSRRSTTSSSARRSSPGRGSTSAGSSSCPGPGATSPRSSTRPARRSSSCGTRTARSAPSTTSAATAATSSSGTTTRARRRAGPAASSPASTTAGATTSTAS